MAVLIECLLCHRKQGVKNKKCTGCGDDLDRQKSQRVEVRDEITGEKKRRGKSRYHIQYRTPDGRQHRQFVGYSAQEARDADGKRKVQKREGRIFEMIPGTDMTFNQLTEWFLEQKAAKRRKSGAFRFGLKKFNETFGDTYVTDLKASALEKWMDDLLGAGLKPSTVHSYKGFVLEMLTKADDDDLIDPRALKPFKKAEDPFEMGSNARKETLSLEDYQRLLPELAPHIRPIIVTMMHTGMRQGEVIRLEWPMVDSKAGMLRLPGTITKNGKPRDVPVNHHVERVLQAQRFGSHPTFVFHYYGKQIVQGITQGFGSACQRVGIPYGQEVEGGVIPHDIRATVKTNMLESGVEKTLRDAIVGHSLEGMDKHYMRFQDEHLKGAINTYTIWFDTKVANLVTHPVTQGASLVS